MTKRGWRWLAIAIVALLIGGGSVVAWRVWPRERSYITDARNIRRPIDAVQVRDIVWDEPTDAEALLQLTDGATEYAFDADRQVLVYVQGAGTDADVYERRRVGEQWNRPVPLDTINSAHIERDVALSPDGQTLLFASDRPGVKGGFDLFVSRRDGDRWSQPELLAHASSGGDDLSPTLAVNNTLYFSSNRRHAVAFDPDRIVSTDTSRVESEGDQSATPTSFDLFATTLKSTAPPTSIDVANTPAAELGPCLSPVGDFLYFASDRDAGCGGFDIYRLRILIDGYGAVEPLDKTINSKRDELDPYLGLAGFELTYRSIEQGDGGAALYRAVSREVFRDVTFERGTIDWAALWRQIGPNLLWAAFALLLSLLFLALIRDFRDRQVSLLARCLALSLFVHLLLMLAFNLLKVTTTLASSLGKSSGMHVTLTSTANAGEIGQQVRGAFVDAPTFAFEMPTEAAPQLAQAEVTLPPRREFTPTESNSSPSESQQIATSFEIHSTDASLDVATSQQTPSHPTMPLPPSATPNAIATEIQTPTAQPAANTTEAALKPMTYALASDEAATPPLALNTADVETAISQIEPSPSTPLSERMANDQSSIQTVEVTSQTAAGVASPSAPTLPIAASDLSASPSLATTDISLPASEPIGEPNESEAVAPITLARVSDHDLALPAMATANTSEWKLVESEINSGPAEITETDATDISPLVPNDDHASVALALPATNNMATPLAVSSLKLPDVELPGTTSKQAAANTNDEPALAVADTTISDAPSALPALSLLLTEPSNDSTRLKDIEPSSAGSWVTNDAAPIDSHYSATDSSIVDTGINEPSNVTDLPSAAMSLALNMPNDATDKQAILEGLGRIVGRVVNADDGSGMATAQVRLTLPEDASVVVEADEAGGYALDVPAGVPEHFALSASADGFVPESVNIPLRRVQGQTLTVNFALSRVTELVIALEDEPDVHHLGNDRFEGRINSQFQKRSEGRTYRASFDIKRSQLPPNFSRAEIVMLVKGVQCPHQVRINSRLVDDWLSSSPRDGSFGEYRAAFSPDWLVEGTNRFKIRARSCGGDLDDFEFVNVQIRLLP